MFLIKNADILQHIINSRSSLIGIRIIPTSCNDVILYIIDSKSISVFKYV